MTSQPNELGRKVTQLGDDVTFIYEKLDQMDKRQQRFAREVRKRFDAHDARFDAHDARFDAHDARFDAHDARFDAHDARFDAHDARFDAHDARFDAIDATLAEVLRRLPEPPA